jgi:hypothetical protein
MRVLKAFFVAAAAAVVPFSFFIACSGGSAGNGGGDGGDAMSNGDSFQKKDQGSGSSSGAGGSSSGSSACADGGLGTEDLKVTVVNFFPAIPVAGAAVRAENAMGACAEALTGADGVAHVMVDMAMGPYDVTVAGANLTIGDGGAPVTLTTTSVLGVSTAPMPGPVQVSPQSTAMNFGTQNVKGNITIPGSIPVDAGGGDGGSYKVQIDGWDFNTVVQAATLPTYATTYEYDYSKVPNGLALPLAGIVVDPTGTAVTGVYTASTPRTGSVMGINVDFTMGPLTPTTTTLTIQWPAAGLVVPAELTTIGTPAGQNAVIGNAIVVKTTPMEASAEQFVGIGNVNLPDSNGKSTLTLQTFPAPMDPSIADAVLFGMKYVAEVQPHNLMSGATEAVGQVNTLTVTPGSAGDLSDVTFSIDSTGYDYSYIQIWNSKAMTPVYYWTIYATGGTVMSRKLPNLPSSVASTDVIAVATVGAYVGVEKLRTGAPPAWGATAPDTELNVSQNGNTNSTSLMATGK